MAIVSTTTRELERTDINSGEIDELLELAVFDESRFGRMVLASTEDAENFEAILTIISNGSFPRPGKRENLTDGERRQLRDAQIFATHVFRKRDVFVTKDKRGYDKAVLDGRRWVEYPRSTSEESS